MTVVMDALRVVLGSGGTRSHLTVTLCQRLDRRLKDPVAAGTHFVGLLAAVAGLFVLLEGCEADTLKTWGLGIYGSSLVGLFLASTIYHALDLGDRGNQLLRKLDHAGIFLLIAGCYVPAIVHFLDGSWRVGMLWAVGSVALAGILFKLLWIDCPRWLSAGLYVAMGWMLLIPGDRFFDAMPDAMFTWLLAGAVLYLVGAVVYVLKRPDPWPGVFGFHEIWHIFVLAAAAVHYVFFYDLIGLPIPT